MSRESRTVVFVGAFGETRDGSVGGQLFACRALIRSEMANFVTFVTIDSTMVSVPPPPMLARIGPAVSRIFAYLGAVLKNGNCVILIFSGSGAGFLEKGLMVMLGAFLKRRVLFFPRSGLIKENINRSNLFLLFVKIVFSASSIVLCQSNAWQDYYREISNISWKKFRVLKNWIDLELYPSDYSLRKFDKDVLTITYIGWLEHHKGVHTIIDAIQSCPEMQRGKKYIICGRGSEDTDMRLRVNKLGLGHLFDFKGWVTGGEKLKVLGCTNILVLPSFHEGLPNVILEAMASECCVVASAVGAIPDTLEHGVSGILIRAGDSKGLADAVLDLCTDREKMKKMARSSRTVVEENHSLRKLWRLLYSELFP